MALPLPITALLAEYPVLVTSTLPQSVSVASASTETEGVVRLNDTVSCESTTQAATARAVSEAHAVALHSQRVAESALSLANTIDSRATTALNNACSALTTANTAVSYANVSATEAASARCTAEAAIAQSSDALSTAYAANTSASQKVPSQSFTARGDILVGVGSGAYNAVPTVGDGRVLTSCSSAPEGVAWSSQGVSGTFVFGDRTLILENGLIVGVS